MLETFLNLPIESITVLVLKVFIGFSFLAAIVFSYNNMSIVLGLIFPIKNSVDIVNIASETNLYKMAVSKEDVLWYLSRINQKNPSFLKGLSRIYFIDRPIGVPTNVLGAFYPFETEGRVIHLYPTHYDENAKMFYLQHYDKNVRVGYNEIQMKENILSTLGHEIGHNVAFSKTDNVKGEQIERFCNEFSEKLYIVEDRIKEGRKYQVSKES